MKVSGKITHKIVWYGFWGYICIYYKIINNNISALFGCKKNFDSLIHGCKKFLSQWVHICRGVCSITLMH